MGREIQKKKARSGIAKVRQKPKSKKHIFGNAYIAANWDPSKTLAQNYHRLGLATKLNKPTGGVEKLPSTEETIKRSRADALAISGGIGEAAAATAKPSRKRRLAEARGEPPGAGDDGPRSAVQEVRIVRDPKTGKILQVLDDEGAASGGGGGGGRATGRGSTSAQETARTRFTRPDAASSDEFDGDDDEEFHGFDDAHASSGYIGSSIHTKTASSGDEADGDAIRSLSEDARRAASGPKVKRKQSEGEKEWCRKLVAKHGDDFQAMARDAKLNPMQQSLGDVRRRVKAYAAGLRIP